MKKYLLVVVILAFGTISFAQGNRNYDKVKSMKIAYITDSLELSPEEAQVFWPVYNQYNDKIHALRKEFAEKYRGYIKKGKSIEDITEEQAAKFLKDEIIREEKILKERQDFFNKIQKVISSKKTMLLVKAENDFNKKLIKELKHRQGGRK